MELALPRGGSDSGHGIGMIAVLVQELPAGVDARAAGVV